MKNITLAVDEGVLERVRHYAAENKTTVNSLVRDYLGKIAVEKDRIAEARANLLRLSQMSAGDIGPNYRWNREELYVRPVLFGHQHPDLRGGRDE